MNGMRSLFAKTVTMAASAVYTGGLVAGCDVVDHVTGGAQQCMYHDATKKSRTCCNEVAERPKMTQNGVVCAVPPSPPPAVVVPAPPAASFSSGNFRFMHTHSGQVVFCIKNAAGRNTMPFKDKVSGVVECKEPVTVQPDPTGSEHCVPHDNGETTCCPPGQSAGYDALRNPKCF